MENERNDGAADMFDEAAALWERARDRNEEAVAEYKKSYNKSLCRAGGDIPRPQRIKRIKKIKN